MNKMSFLALAFALVGCAGFTPSGGGASISYAGEGRGPGATADDASHERVSSASRDVAREPVVASAHSVRQDVDFFVCAQCRR
jgi:hypothetical protein